MIHGHGDDLYSQKGEIKHNFSSNVYYHGCSDQLKDHLINNMDRIMNYPSPDANELSIKAAEYYDLSVDQILFTNGATEAFYLIAQLFRNKRAIIFTPTFSEYEDACQVHNLETQLISRKELFSHEFNTDLAFICNPNNPDGEAIELRELQEIIQQNPTVNFVIDEAYIEFTTSVTSCFDLLNQFNNIIVVRSLTKTYEIPGLRLGYLVSNSLLITEIQKGKMPWSVNAMAIASGKYIFDNHSELTFNPKVLLKEKARFVQELSVIDWIKIIPSNTSYFLVELNKGKASELKTYLSDKHQLLVRDATNFKGLEGEFIRLSTQSPEANKALIKALKEWK